MIGSVSGVLFRMTRLFLITAPQVLNSVNSEFTICTIPPKSCRSMKELKLYANWKNTEFYFIVNDIMKVLPLSEE